MKRIFTTILSLLIILMSNCTVFANATQMGSYKHVECCGYSFIIHEKDGEDCSLIRTYVSDNSLRTYNNFDKTKAVLLALGIDQDTIDNFSNETLEIYSNSPKISSITSYVKIDEFDNQTYVNEETALLESSKLQAVREENFLSRTSQSKTDQDSYMKLVHTVSYAGKGVYLLTADATWLLMPEVRKIDSIGACAMNATTIESTISGNFSYDETTIFAGKTSTVKRTGKINSKNSKDASQGNWSGAASILNLPSDNHTPNVVKYIKNYKAHYQHKCHVNYPSLESYFNTVGCYSHTTVMISMNSPSI